MMTIDEAVQYNKNLREYMKISDKESEYKFLEENYIALDMAIKALEQEPILDKIRAEIEALEEGITSYHNDRPWIFKDEVLKIIDKYKAESENEVVK